MSLGLLNSEGDGACACHARPGSGQLDKILFLILCVDT